MIRSLHRVPGFRFVAVECDGLNPRPYILTGDAGNNPFAGFVEWTFQVRLFQEISVSGFRF